MFDKTKYESLDLDFQDKKRAGLTARSSSQHVVISCIGSEVAISPL
jgi:hypothetical protein